MAHSGDARQRPWRRLSGVNPPRSADSPRSGARFPGIGRIAAPKPPRLLGLIRGSHLIIQIIVKYFNESRRMRWKPLGSTCIRKRRMNSCGVSVMAFQRPGPSMR
jgi:hypothetical protein